MIPTRLFAKVALLVFLAVATFTLPFSRVKAQGDCGANCVWTDDGIPACLLNQPGYTFCIPTDYACYQFPNLCL